MEKRRSIELKVLQWVEYGYAIYVQECLEDKTQEVPQRLDILEENEWFVSFSFTEQEVKSKSGFRYNYFVASWDDPSEKLPYHYPERFISFEKLQQSYLKRTESLNDLVNDEWFDIAKRVFINVSFLAQLPYSEAVFITGPLSNNEFDQKLVRKGQRLQHLTNGEWRIQLDYSVEDILRLNGDLKYLFFKSYYHYRDETYCELLNKIVQQIENAQQIIKNLNAWLQKQNKNPENFNHPFLININFTGENFNVEIPNPLSTPTKVQISSKDRYDFIVSTFGCSKLVYSEKKGTYQGSLWDYGYPNRVFSYGFQNNLNNVYSFNPKTKSYSPNYGSSSSLSSTSTYNSFSDLPHSDNNGQSSNNQSPKQQRYNIYLNFSDSGKFRINSNSNTVTYQNKTIERLRNKQRIENIDHFTYTISSFYGQLNTQLYHYSYDKNQKLNMFRELNLQIQQLKKELENLFEQRNFNHEMFNQIYQQLKQLLSQLVTNLPDQSDLEQILDWCSSQIQNRKQGQDVLTQNLISQYLSAVQNKSQSSADFTLLGDEMQILKLLKLSKEWGLLIYQNHSSQKNKENEIYNMFGSYLKCDKICQNLFTKIILLYYYDHYQEFVKKVEHDDCQAGFKQQIDQNFSSFQVGEQEKSTLRTYDAYKLLDQFINYPLQNFVQKQNLILSSNEQYLYKFLLEFILLYSFGRNINSQIPNMSISGCSEFSPFCQDYRIILTNNYLNELLQQKQNSSSQMENKLKSYNVEQSEKNLQQQCIKTNNTDLLGLLQIKLNVEEILKVQDLNKIKQDIVTMNAQIDSLSNQVQFKTNEQENGNNVNTQRMVNEISYTPIIQN